MSQQCLYYVKHKHGKQKQKEKKKTVTDGDTQVEQTEWMQRTEEEREGNSCILKKGKRQLNNKAAQSQDGNQTQTDQTHSFINVNVHHRIKNAAKTQRQHHIST